MYVYRCRWHVPRSESCAGWPRVSEDSCHAPTCMTLGRMVFSKWSSSVAPDTSLFHISLISLKTDRARAAVGHLLLQPAPLTPHSPGRRLPCGNTSAGTCTFLWGPCWSPTLLWTWTPSPSPPLSCCGGAQSPAAPFPFYRATDSAT